MIEAWDRLLAEPLPAMPTARGKSRLRVVRDADLTAPDPETWGAGPDAVRGARAMMDLAGPPAPPRNRRG